MSQVPDETLRKILNQIQQRAVQSQRALQVTKTQSNAKERDRRIAQITIGEINTLEQDTRLYRSVGKMFMLVPKEEMMQDLDAKVKEISEEISALDKKAKYLEKQSTEAQAQLRDIFQGARTR